MQSSDRTKLQILALSRQFSRDALARQLSGASVQSHHPSVTYPHSPPSPGVPASSPYHSTAAQSSHVLTLIEQEPNRGESGGSSGNLSIWGCTAAVVNLILGNAVFTIPYAFSLGGWMGIPVVILTVLVFLWTAVLMCHTLDQAKNYGVCEPDYGVVGQLAFGPSFRGFFTAFVALECFFLCVFFLAFIAETLAEPTECPKSVLIAGAAAVGTLISLIPKRFVALVAAIGLCLPLACVVSVLACGLSLPTWGRSQSLFGTTGAQGALYTVSFIAIGIADHPIFPGLYNSAKKPEYFVKGLHLGFAIFGFTAVALGGCSYLTFGSVVQPVVLSNMAHDRDLKPIAGLEWIETTANLLIGFKSLLVLPSLIRPVVCVVQGLVGMSPEPELKNRKLRVFFIVLSFALCSLATVAFCDFLPEIEALTSSLFKSINSLIIPCWSYYRLCKPKALFIRLLLFTVIVCGTVWSVCGTWIAVSSMVGLQF